MRTFFRYFTKLGARFAFLVFYDQLNWKYQSQTTMLLAGPYYVPAGGHEAQFSSGKFPFN